MIERKLLAERRGETGKSATARYRSAGKLPAVMYGSKGEATSILVDHKAFSRLFQDITESTILNIILGDSEDEHFEVFVKDYQYDIIRDKIYHVDFYEVERGKSLRTAIEVKLVGSPEGVRFGGVLETGITEIEVECLPKFLPEKIELDVSKLDLNESLHVKDLNLPKEVEVLTDPDLTVAVLKFSKSGEDEEGEGAEASEESTAEAAAN